MEPPNNAKPVEIDSGVEVDGRATADLQPHPPPQNIYMKHCHEGWYMQYNFAGNIFKVTEKYNSLIMLPGTGASGIVCSAMNSETNEKVAIKKITHACRDQITAKRTLREIKLLRHFEHENIVGIKDIVLPPQRDAFEDVYIAYEFMDTDLDENIKYNQELTKYHHQYIMYLFLRGLKYIHSANVLHGDLKPSSILLNANGQLKICDFGLARAASDAMTEYVGPRWYHAPELLLDTSAHTSAIDIWSAGCIFLEMMTRIPLFSGRDRVDQLRLILELIGSPTENDIGSFNESSKQYLRMIPWFDCQSFIAKFPDVPFLAVLLLEKMLKFDPKQRISAEDALADPYFETLHNINNEPVCTKLFEFDLEQHPLTVEQIQELIYHEALAFKPEPLASNSEPVTVENEQ
ncbi:hypothetical protein Bca52824_077922 [Brassica carinata]|uniref:mitogen-activated protein kinase n=1 Tax=Brassica carinata TaxID=52824 RepID=A0A8X7PWP8_BRACI|nr:hypothetical protein Bca52824_077922 [Brassica carinata]